MANLIRAFATTTVLVAAIGVAGCDADAKCGTPANPCGSAGTSGSGGTGGAGGSGGTGMSGTGGASGSGGTGMSGTGGASGSGGTGMSGTGGASGTGGTGMSGTGGTGGTTMPGDCTAPLSEPKPNCRPTAPAATGDLVQDCVDRINQLRAECQCLPPLMRWTEGETCASEQAEYDSTRQPHAGFRDGICSSGSGQNECPGWGSERQTVTGCLQQMWDEGPGEPFSEHGHYINMTNPDHDRVACGFFTTPDGEVWAIQNFR